MRKKNFLLKLAEGIFLVFVAFYIYNKVMFISNNSKITTNNITDKFNIREKNFYKK